MLESRRSNGLVRGYVARGQGEEDVRTPQKQGRPTLSTRELVLIQVSKKAATKMVDGVAR